MQEPTETQKIEYIADMADQLAALCRDNYPLTATMLRAAARTARAEDKPEPHQKR